MGKESLKEEAVRKKPCKNEATSMENAPLPVNSSGVATECGPTGQPSDMPKSKMEFGNTMTIAQLPQQTERESESLFNMF